MDVYSVLCVLDVINYNIDTGACCSKLVSANPWLKFNLLFLRSRQDGKCSTCSEEFFIGSFEFNSPKIRRSQGNLCPIREELPRRCYNTRQDI